MFELPAIERRVLKTRMCQLHGRRALEVRTVEGETYLFVFDSPEAIEQARMSLDRIEGP